MFHFEIRGKQQGLSDIKLRKNLGWIVRNFRSLPLDSPLSSPDTTSERYTTSTPGSGSTNIGEGSVRSWRTKREIGIISTKKTVDCYADLLACAWCSESRRGDRAPVALQSHSDWFEAAIPTPCLTWISPVFCQRLV